MSGMTETMTLIEKTIFLKSIKSMSDIPSEALAQGGLTIYGAECGRFPLCPTVIIEW